ncbi:hypothetical protein AVXHC19_42500 [Acidovorax sacchari]
MKRMGSLSSALLARVQDEMGGGGLWAEPGGVEGAPAWPSSPPAPSPARARARALASVPASGAGQVPAHPGSAAPLLRVDGVSIDYRTPQRAVRATHRVGFDVHEGERLVLLGASGCGKSTLLKSIAGFITPSEGRILLDGQAVTKPGPDRVVVFQEFDQLPPWKTVRENVMFPLLAARRAGRAEAAERAALYLDKVGLSKFADVHPHQLSGGMKQRVAIARALAMQPRVLLMDEPFAALDALTRRRMQEELLALWEEFRFTLIFVTHSIEEALVVGSRVAILSPHPGRLRAEINSHQFGLHSLGGAEFQATAQRIHRLLFDEPDPEEGDGAVPGAAVPARRQPAGNLLPFRIAT